MTPHQGPVHVQFAVVAQSQHAQLCSTLEMGSRAGRHKCTFLITCCHGLFLASRDASPGVGDLVSLAQDALRHRHGLHYAGTGAPSWRGQSSRLGQEARPGKPAIAQHRQPPPLTGPSAERSSSCQPAPSGRRTRGWGHECDQRRPPSSHAWDTLDLGLRRLAATCTRHVLAGAGDPHAGPHSPVCKSLLALAQRTLIGYHALDFAISDSTGACQRCLSHHSATIAALAHSPHWAFPSHHRGGPPQWRASDGPPAPWRLAPACMGDVCQAEA